MLCQSCGQNQATTHIKTIINGELAEVNLCRECAQKLGYNSFFGNFGMDFDKFLGSLMGGSESRTLKSRKRCNCCGSTFEDIAKSGITKFQLFQEVWQADLQCPCQARISHTVLRKR